VLDVLVESFDLKPIGTSARGDLEEILGACSITIRKHEAGDRGPPLFRAVVVRGESAYSMVKACSSTGTTSLISTSSMYHSSAKSPS